MDDRRLSAPARRAFDGLAALRGVEPRHLRVLHEILTACPVLRSQVEHAIESGRITRFGILAEHENAGGSFTPATRSIDLKLSSLTPDLALDTVFVLGHEVQHATHHDDVRQAESHIADVGRRIAERSPAAQLDGSHDYSEVVNRYVQVHLVDEAASNIAGWNAYVELQRARRPRLSLRRLTETSRAIDVVGGSIVRAGFRPGFRPNTDFTLPITPDNVAAMTRTYVDRAPEQAQLGARGTSDYRNYYGAVGISFVAQAHRAVHEQSKGRRSPAIGLDLGTHRLDPRILEDNGIDLGDDRHPLAYVDAASGDAAVRHLRHTASDAGRHDAVPRIRTFPAPHARPHLESVTNRRPERGR